MGGGEGEPGGPGRAATGGREPSPERRPRLRVVFVEDDELVRMAVSADLEDEGCDVLAAATAGEAMGLLERVGGAALLVADLRLGGEGQAAGHVLGEAALARFPGLRVVYATGLPGVLGDGSRAPLGARETVVGKPYRARDVLAAARRLGVAAPAEQGAQEPRGASVAGRDAGAGPVGGGAPTVPSPGATPRPAASGPGGWSVPVPPGPGDRAPGPVEEVPRAAASRPPTAEATPATAGPPPDASASGLLACLGMLAEEAGLLGLGRTRAVLLAAADMLRDEADAAGGGRSRRGGPAGGNRFH